MTTDFDLDAARGDIARVAPAFAGATLVRLGEGMDSVAVLAGDSFVFRFAKHADAALGLRREIALLPRLAPVLPVAVPRLEYAGDRSADGLPFVGYPLIRGEPLQRPLFDGLGPETRDRVLDDLAALLAVVHAFPVDDAAACGVRPYATRSGYADDLRHARSEVLPLLDAEARRAVEARLSAFLDDDANFAAPPVLLHGDLWPEHVLYSPASGRLAGVIDWGDLCLGDPEYDLAFLARRLGPEFQDGLLRCSPPADPARTAAKLVAIALFSALEDAAAGLTRGDGGLVESALSDVLALSAGRPDPGSVPTRDAGPREFNR